MSKKVIIIGGVAGGSTVAARLRRLDETAHIVLVERGEYISFANCGLPYYIGGTIRDRNALFVQTAEGMSKKFNLDIRILSEVVAIHRDQKTVTIKDLVNGEIYEEPYDSLVLSPGASPIIPAIPGIEAAKNLFTLRNVADTDRIKGYINWHQPQKAVVVGGGFIGVEMVENLRHLGLEVTLVEKANQIMAPLDEEMAAILHHHMAENGVRLILGTGVEAVGQEGKSIRLSDGQEIEADLIILAIGVTPENRLAKEAGLAIGERGGILVNESMLTEDPDIYAIGDAVEVKDFILGKKVMIPLAWPANRQGRLVADHIHGKKAKYNGTLGTSIARVFNLTAAVTGMNEKMLKRFGIPYEVVHIHPASHAGYYPGATQLSLKMTFDRETGRIYGAQAIGREGADKRIDVIATAIKGGLTVFELPDLELAYAPPYSSAKDPVNMIGYVASNILEKQVETFQWYEVDDLVHRNEVIVDVREPVERLAGEINGSINIPLVSLRERMGDLPKDRTIYLYCQVGLRGYLASRILMQNGFRVKNLDGGYQTYGMVYAPIPTGAPA